MSVRAPRTAKIIDIAQCWRPGSSAPRGTTTRDDVLGALPDHEIAHFACHGIADWTDPATSRLILHDHQTHPLTVADIAKLRLPRARLAYLSACSTADTNPQHADEVTHLASAFRLAGYQIVIGTLWPISDRAATTITQGFYARLTSKGTTPPDVDNAAIALHHITRGHRDAHPDQPGQWASHIGGVRRFDSPDGVEVTALNRFVDNVVALKAVVNYEVCVDRLRRHWVNTEFRLGSVPAHVVRRLADALHIVRQDSSNAEIDHLLTSDVAGRSQFVESVEHAGRTELAAIVEALRIVRASAEPKDWRLRAEIAAVRGSLIPEPFLPHLAAAIDSASDLPGNATRGRKLTLRKRVVDATSFGANVAQILQGIGVIR